MSKYVCDYEQVKNAGRKLCEEAATLKSTVSKYFSGINSDMAKWTGVAKDSFNSSNDSQIELMNNEVEYLNSLGIFIKDAAQKIESLDNDLSKLEI